MRDLPNRLVLLSKPLPVEGWTALNRGMRDELLRLGLPGIVHQKSVLATRVAQGLSKVGLGRRFTTLGKRRLVTLTWGVDTPAMPDGMWCELIPWMYDCWGPEFPRWESMLRRHKVRLGFFTARYAAEHFGKVIPGLTTHWLPECVDVSLLSPEKPLDQRSVHVLEMGRRVASFHDAITKPLEDAKLNHIYDKGKHATAVPGLADLYARMGDSAIVVCFPKFISHPAGAGPVETVTQRYFEAAASGSLIVGHCPQELKDIFGFSPVVELDANNPGGHIVEVLRSLPAYQSLVNKTLARVREVGNFQVRAAELLRVISEFDQRHG